MGDHRDRDWFLLTGEYARYHVSKFGFNLWNWYFNLGHFSKELLQASELLDVMACQRFLVGMVEFHKEQMTEAILSRCAFNCVMLQFQYIDRLALSTDDTFRLVLLLHAFPHHTFS